MRIFCISLSYLIVNFGQIKQTEYVTLLGSSGKLKLELFYYFGTFLWTKSLIAKSNFRQVYKNVYANHTLYKHLCVIVQMSSVIKQNKQIICDFLGHFYLKLFKYEMTAECAPFLSRQDSKHFEKMRADQMTLTRCSSTFISTVWHKSADATSLNSTNIMQSCQLYLPWDYTPGVCSVLLADQAYTVQLHLF